MKICRFLRKKKRPKKFFISFKIQVRHNDSVVNLASQLDAVELENAKARSCTGVLTSHPRSKDVKIDGVTLTFYGSEILSDTRLEFNSGRRYGLIGLNGCGKAKNLLGRHLK